MQQLEARMALLAKVLGESEPEKSDRLRAAIDLSGQKQIKRRLDQLVQMLQSGDLSGAENAQESLLADLDLILKQLLETASDFDRKRAERERLERFKQGIRTLQEQQLEQLYRNRAVQPDAELARRLHEQADALEKLAERQAELRQKPVAAEQLDQARQAEQRAGELEKLRADSRDAQAAAVTAPERS